MSGPAHSGPDIADDGSVPARLAALRRQGFARAEPLRFRFLESLSRRLDGQPAAVRRLLQAKLEAALADCATHTPALPEAPRAAPQSAALSAASRPTSPLAQLNRYLRDAALAHRAAAGSALGEAPGPDELASAQRFQRAWASSRSQAQVAQATARRPLNAGPLNSHGLVLQSLALMEELSPDYLQRFLMQVETLQWLSANSDGPAEGKARPSRTGRRPRSGKPAPRAV